MKEFVTFLQENKIEYLTQEPMKLHTSFRIGGNAKIFLNVTDKKKLCAVLKYCDENSLDHFIIGNGSNLLVGDEGTDKIIIHLCGDFDYIKAVDETTIEAGAGASLISLCKFALDNELTGLEFAYGIPGSVGGAVFMNAGAYGGEMKNIVKKVYHIDKTGQSGSYGENELDFGYRHSAYGNDEAKVITDVVIRLQKGNAKDIADKMKELLQRRKDKQPLEYPSAGSVFKRPEGYFAGALIEQSGLKGKRIGGAMVSEKHAGFIVNAGDATGDDVFALIELCRNTVKEKFGVLLETEIRKV